MYVLFSSAVHSIVIMHSYVLYANNDLCYFGITGVIKTLLTTVSAEENVKVKPWYSLVQWDQARYKGTAFVHCVCACVCLCTRAPG